MGGKMSSRLDEFRAYREKMNERILASDHLGIKRFFNLDTTAYHDGALPGGQKSCSAWLHPPFCAVTIVLIIT
jgi:hypothetical protein